MITADELRALSREALDDWLTATNAEAMALRQQIEVLEHDLALGYRVLRERLIRATT